MRFRDEIQLPVLNFTYHLPKLWINQLAHINGKKPEYANLSHNLTNLVSVTSLPVCCMYLCLIVVYTGIQYGLILFLSRNSHAALSALQKPTVSTADSVTLRYKGEILHYSYL